MKIDGFGNFIVSSLADLKSAMPQIAAKAKTGVKFCVKPTRRARGQVVSYAVFNATRWDGVAYYTCKLENNGLPKSYMKVLLEKFYS